MWFWYSFLSTNFFLKRNLCALILKEWIMITLFSTCLFHWWIWSSRFFVSDLISFIFIIGWNFLIMHFVLYSFCVLLEGKARWRKEIHLVLSEKNLFLLTTCVILIMLISSQMFFSFHDLIDNGNSTKKWYSCSVWSRCWLLYCLLLFLLCERDHSLFFEISLSPKYFSYGFIFQQVI